MASVPVASSTAASSTATPPSRRRRRPLVVPPPSIDVADGTAITARAFDSVVSHSTSSTDTAANDQASSQPTSTVPTPSTNSEQRIRVSTELAGNSEPSDAPQPVPISQENVADAAVSTALEHLNQFNDEPITFDSLPKYTDTSKTWRGYAQLLNNSVHYQALQAAVIQRDSHSMQTDGKLIRGSIPYQQRPFVNRHSEMVLLLETTYKNYRLRAQLQTDHPVFASLLTSPGMGKTALLLRWMTQAFATEVILDEFMGQAGLMQSLRNATNRQIDILDTEQQHKLTFLMRLHRCVQFRLYSDILSPDTPTQQHSQLLAGDDQSVNKPMQASLWLTCNLIANVLLHYWDREVTLADGTRQVLHQHVLSTCGATQIRQLVSDGKLFEHYTVLRSILPTTECTLHAFRQLQLSELLLNIKTFQLLQKPITSAEDVFASIATSFNDQLSSNHAFDLFVIHLDEAQYLADTNAADSYFGCVCSNVGQLITQQQSMVCPIPVVASTSIAEITSVVRASGFFVHPISLGLLTMTDIRQILQANQIEWTDERMQYIHTWSSLIDQEVAGVPRIIVEALLPELRKSLRLMAEHKGKSDELKLWKADLDTLIVSVKQASRQWLYSKTETAYSTYGPLSVAVVILCSLAGLYVQRDHLVAEGNTIGKFETFGLLYPNAEVTGLSSSALTWHSYTIPRVVLDDAFYGMYATEINQLLRNVSNQECPLTFRKYIQCNALIKQEYESNAENGGAQEPLIALMLWVRYIQMVTGRRYRAAAPTPATQPDGQQRQYNTSYILRPLTADDVQSADGLVLVRELIPTDGTMSLNLAVRFAGIVTLNEKFPLQTSAVKAKCKESRTLNSAEYIYVNGVASKYADLFFWAYEINDSKEIIPGTQQLIGIQSKRVKDILDAQHIIEEDQKCIQYPSNKVFHQVIVQVIVQDTKHRLANLQQGKKHKKLLEALQRVSLTGGVTPDFRTWLPLYYIEYLLRIMNWKPGYLSADFRSKVSQNTGLKRCHLNAADYHVEVKSDRKGYSDPEWDVLFKMYEKQDTSGAKIEPYRAYFAERHSFNPDAIRKFFKSKTFLKKYQASGRPDAQDPGAKPSQIDQATPRATSKTKSS